LNHLQAQRDISITVFVILLEYICHPLQTNARLHEQIETQCIASVAVVRAVQQGDELLGKAVPEGDECFVELGVGYATTMVLVETVEKAAPSREESP
jgi:hypothetical protein